MHPSALLTCGSTPEGAAGPGIAKVKRTNDNARIFPGFLGYMTREAAKKTRLLYKQQHFFPIAGSYFTSCELTIFVCMEAIKRTTPKILKGLSFIHNSPG
jgi:hypothetical protein